MQEHKELYRWSREEAKRSGEIELWRESYRENCNCAKAIEKEISERFQNNYLSADIAKKVIEEYGYDRVNWVLANTVQEGIQDGRYSSENKQWALSFYIPKEEEHRNCYFAVSSHPCLVDGVIDQARKAWQMLGLYNYGHCYEGNTDYTGKVVVLRADILKDEYKTPDNQLFYAQSGFGCRPEALGTKVFGCFLKDGEKTYYRRNEIIGALKEEYLPDWAKEQLEKLTAGKVELCEEKQTEDMSMGGIT